MCWVTAGIWGCQGYPQGEQVYDSYCINCHMSDGSGLGTLVPSLNSQRFRDLTLEEMACKIKYGNKEIEDFYASFNPMPHFTNLSDTDISNLINYLNSQWGQRDQMTSPQEVNEALVDCEFNPERATK
ncbi:MAG: hypothetical protein DRI69_01760 [Bacteroidetes bacterium]|nr:MAG: hypothetical protein DRI69_01760 [Bacteroidota bacterium]